jgi:hypothetical protein
MCSDRFISNLINQNLIYPISKRFAIFSNFKISKSRIFVEELIGRIRQNDWKTTGTTEYHNITESWKGEVSKLIRKKEMVGATVIMPKNLSVFSELSFS